MVRLAERWPGDERYFVAPRPGHEVERLVVAQGHEANVRVGRGDINVEINEARCRELDAGLQALNFARRDMAAIGGLRRDHEQPEGTRAL
jgi:hypothetical protein